MAPWLLDLLRKAGLLFLTIFNSSIALVVLYVVFRHSDATILVAPNGISKLPEVEFKDYVVIVLTALGVMIAIGGALIAFLTVFGYAEGMRLIENHVQRAVLEKLDPSVQRAMEAWAMSSPERKTDINDEELRKIIDSLVSNSKEGKDDA